MPKLWGCILTTMTFYAYLLLSISHMESGLHGVTVGGGSGALVGSRVGILQSGWSICFAGQ